MWFTEWLVFHCTQKLDVGDLVQARWEDGRMYFGQVQHLSEGENKSVCTCKYIMA